MPTGPVTRILHFFPALLSGAMMALLFPRAGLSALAWICLVPVIVMLLCYPRRSIVLQGIVAGTVFHLGLVYWVVVSMNTYGGVPLPAAFVLLAVFALFLSVFVALPLWCSVFIQRHIGARLTLTLPLCWVAAEYVKSWFLTGFPWELLGYSQFQYLQLIQIADITGIYGVSFVIVSVNCAVAAIVHALIARTRTPFLEPCCALVLVVACLLYGNMRVQQFHAPEGQQLRALLVQPNIPQDLKWDPGYLEETMRRLFYLSTQSEPEAVDLIIWPESATPFFFQSEPAYHTHVVRTVRRSGAGLLFGSPSFTQTPAGQRYFNSAFLLRSDGSVAGRYDKVHLVPWGEYVPLQQLFPFINRLVAGIGDFSPGEGMRLLSAGEISFATLICYEIIFPNLTRRFVRLGGRCIINITNDAWFGRTCAPYQHLSMAVLRAVENKRFVLRAANTGISAAIAPTGRIIDQTGLFTETALPATITAMDHLTVYTRIGDLFAAACLLASAALLLVAYRRRPQSA
jgi:apolipoprotein N-acyltransferase